MLEFIIKWKDDDESKDLETRFFHGDIITLDYAPSSWTPNERQNVVYMNDFEVMKLCQRFGMIERELWQHLDESVWKEENEHNLTLVMKRRYKVDCEFHNEDGLMKEIKAENIIKKA